MKFIRVLYLAAALSVAPAGMMMAQTASGHFIHTVTKGQSLYSISAMYNVAIADIVKLNPGSDERIREGQTLKIPQTSVDNKVIFHTIQPGETLYKLSVKHGVSVERICRANPGLSAKNFRIGQVIAIPPKGKASSEIKAQTPVEATPQVQEPQPEKSSKPKYRELHKIQRKETVYSISRMYGITEEELKESYVAKFKRNMERWQKAVVKAVWTSIRKETAIPVTGFGSKVSPAVARVSNFRATRL